jgi:ribonuclease P protein component
LLCWRFFFEVCERSFFTILADAMDEKKTRQFTFTKEERLCSKTLTDKLFTEGKTVYQHPLRFVFIPVGEGNERFPVQVVFSVPKRNYKRAVDRNLIRRRMREAYRLEKSSFYELFVKNGKSIALMIIYTHKAIDDYHVIHHSLVKGMKKVITKVT